MQNEGLFGNYKYCELCRKPLSLDYEDTLCPLCLEHQLFQKVKEFIRENDVNEYDVAEEFNIPLHQVKHWIREGRIEYKDKRLNNITLHCVTCGAPINFGTHCSKCMRQKNTVGHSTSFQSSEPSRMRYLEDANKH